MNRDVLAEWLDARPFEPFRVKLSNGESFEVTRPQDLIPGMTTAVLAIPWKENPRFYERFKTVSIEQMVMLEPLKALPQEG